MKRYIVSYWFLSIVLITGTFASTAQHAYGLKLCGLACLGFAATFLYELATASGDALNAPRWIRFTELVSLSVIALIFAMKNFSLDLTISDVLVVISLAVLGLIYSYRAVKVGGALYYSAVIVMLIMILAGQMLPSIESVIAIAGVALSFVLLTTAIYFRKPATTTDDAITPFEYIAGRQDRSVIILVAGLLFGTLGLLQSARIAPPLYRGTLPDGYQRLVEEASPNGDAKAQELKERYEKFVQNAGQ